MSEQPQLAALVLARAAQRLAAAGIENPRLDARLLLQAATGMARELLVSRPGHALTLDQIDSYERMIERRCSREPVWRILGEREFHGRKFRVTPDTLDPRPDTETLVELALALADEEGWRDRPIEILDVGTGTGAILLTLLAELPLARGLGTDVSAPALEIARANAERLSLAERVRWQLVAGLAGAAGKFDLVVSNPPYIPSGEIPLLDPEVRLFDPLLALDGGPDGMAIFRSLVNEAATGGNLAAGAWMVLEVGAGQSQKICEMARKASFDGHLPQIRLAEDLGGHTRCVAWKPQ